VHGNVVIGRDAGSTGSLTIGSGVAGDPTTFTVSATGAGDGNLTVGNAGAGQLAINSGALSVANTLRVNGTATQNGGTVSAGAVSIAPGAAYDLSGGTASAGAIVNNGALNFSGGGPLSTTAGLTNNGQVNLSGAGTRVIDSAATNAATGVFSVNGTTAQFTGAFANAGGYQSSGSTNLFATLSNESTGYLTGGSGDVFSISGNFINHSTQNALWSTTQAELAFTGAGAQEFDFAGADFGSSSAGYVDNFAFGDLSLEQGVRLNIADGNPINAGAALYIGVFDLANHDLSELANINSPFNIYYDSSLAGNAYLNDETYAFGGGGFLVPIGAPTPTPAGVPEPRGAALFAVGLSALAAAAWRRRRRSC
jgi:hypothetical protein